MPPSSDTIEPGRLGVAQPDDAAGLSAVTKPRAMVLAAGLGTRMRPITDTIPKPLVEVAGRTLLDRALDRLEETGVTEVVVNVHYLRDKIEHHLRGRRCPRVRMSAEPERLETGGGVARALPLLGEGPFFVVNSDIVLLNGPHAALVNLAAAWRDEHMDALLLLHPTVEAPGYEGSGDFEMDQVGRLRRRDESHLAPYLFTGIQILQPRLFRDLPAGPFSLNVLYDRAIEAGRLFGLLHDGKWFHVGRPGDLRDVEEYLAKMHAGVRRT